MCSPSAQSAASQLELVQKQDLSPDIIPRTDSGDTSRNYVIELQTIPRFSQSWRRPLLANDAQFCLRSLSARQHFAQLTRENSFVLVNNYTRERRSIEHLSCFAGLVITNCRGCAPNILLQSLVFTLSVIAFWWENGDQVYW